MATTTVDVDSIAGDATRRLGDLEEARMRLSPEALIDSEVAAELAQVEAEIRDCERALERVALARREQERRTRQAQADAAAKDRSKHLDAARKLQSEREKAAKAVDVAVTEFALKLREWDVVTTKQESALRRAGEAQLAEIARPQSWMAEAMVAWALREAGCPRGILRLRGLEPGPGAGAPIQRRHMRPLAEIDARPIEAAKK